jgi:hypothetical protein
MKKQIASIVALLLAANAHAQTSAAFGTFEKPFAADSPWNIRPIGPVLGLEDQLKGTCGPRIEPNAELGPPIFQATAENPPMIVYPILTESGIRELDSVRNVPSITIPHFPPAVTPAWGGDGHADIFDNSTGKIHSFWGLKQVNGLWRARAYAWTTIGGRGWGDPSRYYQGSRAVGVPPMAGIIRAHEVDDGDDSYNHALAMSLAQEGLAGKNGQPTYIYPATRSDLYSATNHTGTIPEGALLMLPADYTMGIQNPTLQKVVQTLKTFGARVVDENICTPYFIYVETGANFDIFAGVPTGSQQAVRDELQKIRKNLRQVTTAYSYVDGNGQPTTADKPSNFNMLSMRGTWTQPVTYNANTGNLELAAGAAFEQLNGNGWGVSASVPGETGVLWAKPLAGAKYRFTVTGTGGASLRFAIFVNGAAPGQYQTPALTNGQSQAVTWPEGGSLAIYVRNTANQAGTVRATMIKE